MAARRPFVGGNWKCNGTRESVAELITMLNGGGQFDGVDVFVFPPALFLDSTMSGLNHVQVGAQDSANRSGYGAFTGAHTPEMLAAFGIQWTLAGHSERRGLYNEADEVVATKTLGALAAGMNVVLCVGEQLEQRQEGATMEVVISQLQHVLGAVDPASLPRLVIAYEPVWAIGTGLTASPAQAQEVHAGIRDWMGATFGEGARDVRIIYGGSVKGANCQELAAEPDIDGFLVGGASLKPDFLNIIASVTPSSA